MADPFPTTNTTTSLDGTLAPATTSPPPPQPQAVATSPRLQPPVQAKEEQPAIVPATAPARADEAIGCGRRQRFAVELKPGETTIVSWKKLLKESEQATGPSPPRQAAPVGEPAFPAHPGPSSSAGNVAEDDPKEEPTSNRFSAVIEKIERLYMGNDSDDEEDPGGGVVPDDDQYDTNDSFIDDAELDEYFEVDELETKHNGYFVNKGKLEQIEPGAAPKAAPKKRRRKDTSSTYNETNQDLVSDPSGLGTVSGKVSATSYAENKLAGSNPISYGESCHEGSRVKKNKINPHAKKKSTDFTSNADNLAHMKKSNKDISLVTSGPKDFDKHRAGPPSSNRSRGTGESYDYGYPAYHDQDVSTQFDFQSKTILNGESENASAKVRRREKYGTSEFSDRNTSVSSYSMEGMQPTTTRVREGSAVRPKGTRLERAIRDLEKIIAESRPPNLELQEVDPATQVVKRRLPQEVKQKLAKVARLAASQGKFSNELTDRLMGILGHLMQRRTLKKNMKEMVESGISAKQEKADRFQHIKSEINDMIRVRVSSMKSKVAEQQDGSTDDFQDNVGKIQFNMDAQLEDKICDLYDLYVEGMDEDKGPQSRKLYVELVELWPQGHMDKVGVKDAISRSKERRRVLYRQQKVRSEERMKRRKLASAVKLEEGHHAIAQAPQVPLVTQPFITSAVATYPVIDYGDQVSKNVNKVRELNRSTVADEGNRNLVEVKKKKRKPESDMRDANGNPLLQHGKEKLKSHKLADESNAAGNLVLGLPRYEQPS